MRNIKAGKRVIEPLEQYHANTEFLGSSALKEARKSLRHFKTYIDGEKRINATTRKAFDLGTCAHAVILEQDWSQVICGPEVSTKAVKAWKDCVVSNPDKYVLTPLEYQSVQRMAEAVQGHALASSLLRGLVENSFYSQDHQTGLLVKARPDVLLEDATVDVKTTGQSIANDRLVANRIFDLGYDLSGAHYGQVVESASRQRIRRHFLIFVENFEPYGIRVFELSRDVLDEAAAVRASLMLKIAQAVKSNTFNGYDEGLSVIQLPPWTARSDEGVA